MQGVRGCNPTQVLVAVLAVSAIKAATKGPHGVCNWFLLRAILMRSTVDPGRSNVVLGDPVFWEVKILCVYCTSGSDPARLLTPCIILKASITRGRCSKALLEGMWSLVLEFYLAKHGPWQIQVALIPV